MKQLKWEELSAMAHVLLFHELVGRHRTVYCPWVATCIREQLRAWGYVQMDSPHDLDVTEACHWAHPTDTPTHAAEAVVSLFANAVSDGSIGEPAASRVLQAIAELSL